VTGISRASAAAAGTRATLAEATAVRKIAVATAAIGVGMAVAWLASRAWLASGAVAVLAGMGLVLAASNGYAKAYSP
jgi:hypothetical protein